MSRSSLFDKARVFKPIKDIDVSSPVSCGADSTVDVAQRTPFYDRRSNKGRSRKERKADFKSCSAVDENVPDRTSPHLSSLNGGRSDVSLPSG